MVNQETGVRGYALGKDEAFLEPYNLYAAARGAGRRARCASTSSTTPTCSTELRDGSTPRSTTGARRSRSRSSPRCGPATRARPTAAASPEARAAFDRIRDASERAHQRHRRRSGTEVTERPRAGLHLGVGRGRASAPRSCSLTGLHARPRAAPPGARPDRRPGRARPGRSRRATSTSRSPRTARWRSRASAADVDLMRGTAGRPDRAASSGPGTGSSSAAPSWPAPTPTSSSSPTSPRTTCPSRCARSPTSASCSSASTPTSSTTRPASTSPSWSTAPSGCRR